MNKTQNKALLRTSHKVRRPENADVRQGDRCRKEKEVRPHTTPREREVCESRLFCYSNETKILKGILSWQH